MQTINSSCIFCGVGCKLKYQIENNKIIKVLPDKEDDVSQGRPCIKGLSIDSIDFDKRIKKPMIKFNDEFFEVSYERAIEEIARILRKKDPCKIAFYLSALTTNEVIYAFLEIARNLGIHNIDSCARVCHAATVSAMKISFGTGGMFNTYKDLENSKTVLIFGSDPYTAYPVIFNRLMQIKRNNGKIIVFEDAYVKTEDFATKVYKIKPASHKAVAIGILKLIETKDEKFNEYLRSISWRKIERASGLKKRDFEEIVKNIEDKTSIIFGMAVTQNSYGTETVISLANLAIALDANFIPMRGKINVQGAGDLGVYPKKDGMPATMFFYDENIDVYLIHDSNPVKSFPDSEKIAKRLRNAEVIYIGTYFNETAELADIIIPGTFLFEEQGTIVTAERRLRKVNRVVKPEMSLYEFVKKLAEKLNIYLPDTEEEMYLKISMENAMFRGVKPEDFLKIGKRWERLIEVPLRTKEFSNKYIMTTKRKYYQFTTAEITKHAEKLKKLDKDNIALIAKNIARKEKIKDGDKIKIKTSLGSIEVNVKIEEKLAKNMIILPFHYSEIPVNKIIPLELDIISFEPNLKYVEVEIEK